MVEGFGQALCILSPGAQTSINGPKLENYDFQISDRFEIEPTVIQPLALAGEDPLL